MKSKGLYAGVAVDGTIIIERTDENERFYGDETLVDVRVALCGLQGLHEGF
jgi:lipid-binding SYLF domain-containing protein